MALEQAHIIVGAARLWLGNSTTVQLPTPSASQSMVTALNNATTFWSEVGLTSDGLEAAFEPEYLDVEVDQLLDSAALFKMRMRVNLRTSMTEATLKNLGRALGQADNTYNAGEVGVLPADASGAVKAQLRLPGGSLGEFPVERALAAVGNGPRKIEGTAVSGTPERVYYARRVLSVEAVSHSLKRDEVTVFPVSFRLLPDPTYTGAEYGFIRDRVY